MNKHLRKNFKLCPGVSTRLLFAVGIWLMSFVLSGPAAAHASASGTAAAGHPHQVLRQVLENPLFHQWQLRTRQAKRNQSAQSPLQLNGFVDRFWRWLRHLIKWRHKKHVHIYTHTNGVSMFPSVLIFLGWAAIILILLAAAGLLIHMLVRGKDNSAAGAAVPPVENINNALQEGDALAAESNQWLAKAEGFEKSGDLRLMYRALYLALLAGLHERGKIRFRKSATNFTLVRGYSGSETDRNLFGRLTDTFDHIWYGWKIYPEAKTQELRCAIAALLPAEKQNA